MDIFDMFFGGGRSRQRGPAKGKDVVHQLSATLEDLYNGSTRKLALQKNVICPKCEGHGGKKGAVESCAPCRGTGMQIRIQQLAPGMVQQIQSVCHDCQGQGERINPKDRCKGCQGRKVTRQRKILEVHIDKGMKDNQQIRFDGEGDQEPGLEAGDVVIVLEMEEKHAVFERHGADLVMQMELSLVEALCGCQKTIETLDKRTLVIQTLPGEVIKNGEYKCIMNEGMPQYRSPFEKGKLIIKFKITFPEDNWISEEQVAQLETLLPERKPVQVPDEAEECVLHKVDPSSAGARGRGGQAYDEDDDEDMQGPRVQCANQ